MFVKVALSYSSSSSSSTSESRQELEERRMGKNGASDPQLLCPNTISDFR